MRAVERGEDVEVVPRGHAAARIDDHHPARGDVGPALWLPVIVHEYPAGVYRPLAEPGGRRRADQPAAAGVERPGARARDQNPGGTRRPVRVAAVGEDETGP